MAVQHILHMKIHSELNIFDLFYIVLSLLLV